MAFWKEVKKVGQKIKESPGGNWLDPLNLVDLREKKKQEAAPSPAWEKEGYVPYDEMQSGKPSDLYGQAARDWYDFGIDERGQLTSDYQYDPNLIDTGQLQMANPYDFGTQRSQLTEDISRAGSSAYQTGLTNVAAGSGLTAADRMQLASQYNRNVLDSTARGMGDLAVAEAGNIWETDRANQELMNRSLLQNLELQNQARLRNIDTLMQERRTAGDVARDMYERDERIRQAQQQGATF